MRHAPKLGLYARCGARVAPWQCPHRRAARSRERRRVALQQWQHVLKIGEHDHALLELLRDRESRRADARPKLDHRRVLVVERAPRRKRLGWTVRDVAQQ